MFFLNLAPILFKDVTKVSGPIDKLDVFEFVDSLGHKQFEAHAYLKVNLRANQVSRSQIYGSCDGTGTDSSKVQAVRKSIAEALERWAFYSLASENSEQYGLNLDDTSTGFAALPCWPKKAVRENALREAIERWSVSNWWNGRLKAIELNIHDNFRSWEILTPYANFRVTVLSQKVEKSGQAPYYVFGFACGESVEQSLNKALVEMERNRRALSNTFTKGLDSTNTQDISDKRLLYFASEEGRISFLKKIAHVPKETVKTAPELIVDSEIIGPWSKFATVWRCLLENTDTNLEDLDFFLF